MKKFLHACMQNLKSSAVKTHLYHMSAIGVVAVSLAVGLSLSLIRPTSAGAAFGGEIVRLHVIANSDTEADQALKLKVRDSVLAATDQALSKAENGFDAGKIAQENLSVMKQAALETIQKSGYSYSVKVEYGVFPFPVKSYGSITLPAGDYNAVRVIIGEGKGHNWWCVMFPPLCFVNETYSEVKPEGLQKLSAETRDILSHTGTPEFQIKFKLLEMFGAYEEENKAPVI